jgi:hypothetical protein
MSLLKRVDGNGAGLPKAENFNEKLIKRMVTKQTNAEADSITYQSILLSA